MKKFIETLQSIRRFWGFNPRTRVQQNEKKNKKKMREQGKKECRDDK
jgi:hypothetical protein